MPRKWLNKSVRNMRSFSNTAVEKRMLHGGACSQVVYGVVDSVAALVDLVATISYVNEGARSDQVLKAAMVVTSRTNESWRAQNIVIFKAGRELPHALQTRTRFCAPGSGYHLTISTTEPPNCGTRVNLAFPHECTFNESMQRAVHAVSSLLCEDIRHDSFFCDAVHSRYNLFKRCASPPETDGSVSSDCEDELAASAEAPSEPPPPPKAWLSQMPPLPPTPCQAPFQKPHSTRLGDLLWAFATHRFADNGEVVPVSPTEKPPPIGFQRLVFCAF